MCIMQPALTYTIHGFKYLWKLNGKLHNTTNSNKQQQYQKRTPPEMRLHVVTFVLW